MQFNTKKNQRQGNHKADMIQKFISENQTLFTFASINLNIFINNSNPYKTC